MKSKTRMSDLRAMSDDQLDQEVLALKKEQFNLRFQRATGQLENTARVRVVRRDIARAKTLAAVKTLATHKDAKGTASKRAGPRAAGSTSAAAS